MSETEALTSSNTTLTEVDEAVPGSGGVSDADGEALV